jgi:hypothetical protein
MLLIVAQGHDRAAVSLAARWESHEAVLLTARDLSEPGWVFEAPPRGPSRLIAGGRAFTSDEVSGVVTRISSASASGLEHIAVEDRSYVSSEMTAFLLAWLSSLACPMLNRPTPQCLCGPNWHIEQWVHLAARLGIPVDPLRRSTSLAADDEREGGVAVTVVGEQCVGAVHPSLAAQAQRLAKSAHVDLLEVRFTGAGEGGRFHNVSLFPDVSQPEIADAMLRYFESRTESSAPC